MVSVSKSRVHKSIIQPSVSVSVLRPIMVRFFEKIGVSFGLGLWDQD